MYDSGEIWFYKVIDTTIKGQKPKKEYKLIHIAGYEEMTVGVQRYFTALQYDSRITVLARIPSTHLIEDKGTQIVAVLYPYDYVDSSAYRIYQVQHTKDAKQNKVVDVSLVRLEELNANEIISNFTNSCGS